LDEHEHHLSHQPIGATWHMLNDGARSKVDQNKETISERTNRTIDELAAQGFFDNLPGSGKPLDLSDEDNPFIPDDMRLAYRILRNAGYSLPWIEQRKDIEADVAKLERRVTAHVATVQSTLQHIRQIPSYLRASRWAKLQAQHTHFLTECEAAIDALNKKIDDFNLGVPVVSLQIYRMNRQKLLDQIASSLPETPA
jgi:hypothetical protein